MDENEGVVSEWDLVLGGMDLAPRQCHQAKVENSSRRRFLNCGENRRFHRDHPAHSCHDHAFTTQRI